jgi:hypothetical protein
MKAIRQWFYVAALGAFSASTMLLAPGLSRASDDDNSAQRQPSKIKLADLAGSWAISLGGHTGCGLSSMYVTVDLDATGFGMARIISSSTGCPPGDDPAEPFQIFALNPDGSGTAGLSCGPGCGWSFTIQVPQGSTNLFTLVDVSPDNPNNVLVGTAARKWPARSDR